MDKNMNSFATGFSKYRFEGNPMEKKYAEKWIESNKYGSTLEYLLSTNNTLAYSTITDRDKYVAGKLIQWLGSPVGSAFIRDVLMK